MSEEDHLRMEALFVRYGFPPKLCDEFRRISEQEGLTMWTTGDGLIDIWRFFEILMKAKEALAMRPT